MSLMLVMKIHNDPKEKNTEGHKHKHTNILSFLAIKSYSMKVQIIIIYFNRSLNKNLINKNNLLERIIFTKP